jgi:hypothetical protein
VKRSDKIKNIIENSGNDFHLRVADFMRSKGWDVKIGPYYNDRATNKSREVDIIALKGIKVAEHFYNQTEGLFILRLFIECKNLPNPNVLWFVPKNMESAKELAKDNSILRSAGDWIFLNSSAQQPRTHHYLNEGSVMKLGAKTGNTDFLYEAMNGCLNAMIFYKEHQRLETPNVINFPMIVVNNFENLHKRVSESESGYESLTENFQMEVDYSFSDREGKPKTKYFLLDVVSGDKLEEFLESLEKNDIQILKNQLQETLMQQARENTFHNRQNRDDPFNTYF